MPLLQEMLHPLAHTLMRHEHGLHDLPPQKTTATVIFALPHELWWVQGTGTESEPIPAFRGYGGARLMRSELDSGPPAGDNPWSHDHSLR